jgi:rubrerythrin
MSVTLKNLEGALAGESMAHIKYLYFAEIADSEGYSDVADHFRWTAAQELQHAWGHLDLLLGDVTTQECLEKAIEGETYEYTEMYPQFQQIAKAEGDLNAVKEFEAQTQESYEHARQFTEVLKLAQKRFGALAKVEKKHAGQFTEVLQGIQHG